MANYSSVKATIDANIKANNNQEITGVILNGVLDEMVDALASGYLYKGVATPSTNPGTPDAKVFYLASPGTYVNFGGAVIPQGALGVLKYDGSWSSDYIESIGIPLEVGFVEEDGLFFVDSNLNIGGEFIQGGFVALNILEYREV